MAYGGNFSFGYSLTPWVKRLLIANGGMFLLLMAVPELTALLALQPAAVVLRPWTPLTYMFVHGGLWHLFFNMLLLFFFGPPLESRWGSREFLKFYVICGLGGAALSFIFAFGSAVVGASGAIMGVMVAFAMNWPESPIYIWGILPIKAKWLVTILVAVDLFSAFSGQATGIANFAHLGGVAAGFLYLKWWGGGPFASPLKKLRDKMSRRQFHILSNDDAQSERRDKKPRSRRRSRRRHNEEEQLLDRVDQVLDKINTSGLSSLSDEERKLLDEVSRRYRTD